MRRLFEARRDELKAALDEAREDGRPDEADSVALLDRIGAEIMYSVIGPEPKILAQLIANMAIIFNVASIRRFLNSDHKWKRPVVALNSGIIILLSVLIVGDLRRARRNQPARPRGAGHATRRGAGSAPSRRRRR